MQYKTPDHLALTLKAGKVSASSVPEKVYLGETKKIPKEIIEAVEYARDIYENEFKREILEAFLLCQSDLEEIYSLLKIPPEVLKVYSELFFDMEAFKDELDIQQYARTYPNEFGKELKIAAITLGVDFLKYRFDRGKTNLDFKQALSKLVETSYIISRAAKLNPINSQITREARQWMAISVKALEAYAKIKPTFDEADDEFKLILKNIDRTVKDRNKNGVDKKDSAIPLDLDPNDILRG